MPMSLVLITDTTSAIQMKGVQKTASIFPSWVHRKAIIVLYILFSVVYGKIKMKHLRKKKTTESDPGIRRKALSTMLCKAWPTWTQKKWMVSLFVVDKPKNWSVQLTSERFWSLFLCLHLSWQVNREVVCASWGTRPGLCVWISQLWQSHSLNLPCSFP